MKLEIISILIIILIIILFTLFKSNFKDLYNGDIWTHYRLGDVYHQSDTLENLDYHKQKYPNSIAALILNTTPYKSKNEELLLKIVSEKRKELNLQLTTDTDLVLHIRVGDVVCLYDKKNNWYSKIDNHEWWARVLEYIRLNNIKRVYIVAGTHYKECLKESKDYLKNREDFLTKNIPELKVIYRLGKPPDYDFIFFLDAKHFISTGGGFGRIIYNINGNEFK